MVDNLDLARFCRWTIDDHNNSFSVKLCQEGKGNSGIPRLREQVMQQIPKADLSEGIEDRVDNMLRRVLAVGESVVRLREAGLHVRQLDGGGFMGGSHVDASSGLRMVQNGFCVLMSGDKWELDFGCGKEVLDSLDEAVERILATVKPGVDIPGPPPRSGPQMY